MKNIEVLSQHQDDDASLTQAKLLNIIANQAQQIQDLTKQNNWLSEQLKLLKSKYYGKSSEQQSSLQSLQMELFDEDEEALQCESAPCSDPQKETITYSRNKPNRSPKNIDTTHLPREKKLYELNETERSCACGQSMVEFGEESKE